MEKKLVTRKVPKIRNKYNTGSKLRKAKKVNLFEEELIKPFTRDDLKVAIKHGREAQSYFQMVEADIDLSKMNSVKRANFLKNNPDIEEEIESIVEEENTKE